MGSCLPILRSLLPREGGGDDRPLNAKNKGGSKSKGKQAQQPQKKRVIEEVDDDEQENADDGEEDLIGYRGGGWGSSKPSAISTATNNTGGMGAPLRSPASLTSSSASSDKKSLNKGGKRRKEDEEEEEEEGEQDDIRGQSPGGEEDESDVDMDDDSRQPTGPSPKASTAQWGEWASAFIEAGQASTTLSSGTAFNFAASSSQQLKSLSETDDIIRNFIMSLEQGIVVLKHDRKGRSRLRELYTPDHGQSFSWRSPSKGGNGHQRTKSGNTGVFEKDRAQYLFSSIHEVRRGTVPDPTSTTKETGTAGLRASCNPKDLYKSFSLLLEDRTVDFTCHSVEQQTYLCKGFTTMVADCRRKKLTAAY